MYASGHQQFAVGIPSKHWSRNHGRGRGGEGLKCKSVRFFNWSACGDTGAQLGAAHVVVGNRSGRIGSDQRIGGKRAVREERIDRRERTELRILFVDAELADRFEFVLIQAGQGPIEKPVSLLAWRGHAAGNRCAIDEAPVAVGCTEGLAVDIEACILEFRGQIPFKQCTAA